MIDTPYNVAGKHASSAGLQDIVAAAVTYDRGQIAAWCESHAAEAQRQIDAYKVIDACCDEFCPGTCRGKGNMLSRWEGQANAWAAMVAAMRGTK